MCDPAFPYARLGEQAKGGRGRGGKRMGKGKKAEEEVGERTGRRKVKE